MRERARPEEGLQIGTLRKNETNKVKREIHEADSERKRLMED